jgi:putative ferrous iron transport protein C
MNINCGGDRVPPTTSSIPLFLPTVHGVDLPWFPLLWFCDVGVKRSCLILCWWRIKPDQPRARKTRHILADVFLMILAELRQYLSQHKRVALVDLSCHFENEAEARRGMLNMLEHKGCVARLPGGTGCGNGCSKYDSASVEIYQWVSKDSVSVQHS